MDSVYRSGSKGFTKLFRPLEIKHDHRSLLLVKENPSLSDFTECIVRMKPVREIHFPVFLHLTASRGKEKTLSLIIQLEY